MNHSNRAWPISEVAAATFGNATMTTAVRNSGRTFAIPMPNARAPRRRAKRGKAEPAGRGPSGGARCWAARIQEVSATFSPEKEMIWDTDDSSGKKRPSLKYSQITSGERYTLGALHAQ